MLALSDSVHKASIMSKNKKRKGRRKSEVGLGQRKQGRQLKSTQSRQDQIRNSKRRRKEETTEQRGEKDERAKQVGESQDDGERRNRKAQAEGKQQDKNTGQIGADEV